MGHFVQEKAMSESVIDLKSHWSQSRENISKFQKSLRHWQTWEAEYEGLREDISELGDEPTRAQLVRRGRSGVLSCLLRLTSAAQKEAGDGFEGELLNQKGMILDVSASDRILRSERDQFTSGGCARTGTFQSANSGSSKQTDRV